MVDMAQGPNKLIHETKLEFLIAEKMVGSKRKQRIKRKMITVNCCYDWYRACVVLVHIGAVTSRQMFLTDQSIINFLMNSITLLYIFSCIRIAVC